MRMTLLAVLIWCAFGVAIHGWKTLLYPAAWLVIVGIFAFINYRHDRKRDALVSGTAQDTKPGSEDSKQTSPAVTSFDTNNQNPNPVLN